MYRILEDREKRYNKIIELYNLYKKPIVCGKINYPGQNKNTAEAEKAFSALLWSLNSEFKPYILFSKLTEGFDGRSILMAVDLEPGAAKKMAVTIEEAHILGRIFDIDIYVDGESIGREKMNKSPRGCIICGEDARVCMKLSRHTLDEVIEAVNKLIRSYEE